MLDRARKVNLGLPAKVLDALEMVCSTNERREKIFERPSELRNGVKVMRNGRNVAFLDGLLTDLSDGDELAIFPIVCGG